ncbi:MAG TPA: hypothetical protein PL017_02795 [Tenuifilaceae bacterium]|nr:hypothetical protein [Tenuifilaceae bacterium]HPE18914.1 hypothetical protein [Tenuifilaceae bacterium]HPJ44998.1 hypothetical protein [Tenuifilaceae bacterium]HPQ34802.1 hypothetical protein [Tenuifilaceae bacterium]HRX67122.1 hypothetical protein [Tenuifilaceae bacterium]
MKSTNLFHWLPRIIGILAILFVSMFALDSFSPNLTAWQQIGAFLTHLIPSYILLVLLIVAWKWEFVGGIIFIAIGVLTSPWVFIHNYRMNGSVGLSLVVILSITIPFALVGVLFLISYYRKKKKVVDSSNISG